jgi:hypothetical protein
MSVHKFLQKFQQNSMLENVNLSRSTYLSKDVLFSTLSNLLPLIGSINSFQPLNMSENPYAEDAGKDKNSASPVGGDIKKSFGFWGG